MSLYIDFQSGNYSVKAKQEIPENSELLTLKGNISTSPSRYSIQIGKEKHLHPLSYDVLEMQKQVWPFLNHSCDPNSIVDIDSLKLISLRNIKGNEEITFDYELTETLLSEPFICQCKSYNCRGMIKGKHGHNFTYKTQ